MKLLIYFLSILFLVSCGTRNVKKTVVEDETKKEINATEESKESKEEERKVDKDEKTELDESTEDLTPIDPTKPMKKTVEEKDGKKTTTYENASVNTNKRKKSTTTRESSSEKVNTETDTKKETSSKEQSKRIETSKETQSNSSFSSGQFWYWLLLLLIPAMYQVYIRVIKPKE